MDTTRRPPPPQGAAPPTPIDSRGPPPPSHYPPHHPSYYPPHPPHPTQSPYPAHTGPPGSAPPGQVHTLPPIHSYQAPYNPAPGPPPGEGPHQLPPVRQSSHGYYEPRDQQEYHKYNQASRSGHATPAPVNRSYSHDSAHQQHTPTTPAQPGPYPPTSAPEAGPPPHHMDHGPQHGYPPTNGVHANGHPPPPPGPMPQHYETHPPHPMTPSVDQGYAYPPPQHQMYPPQQYGPPIAAAYSTQRKKQMRAQQACEQCRQRKQKCDEGTPCSFCKESNLSCQYRDTPPAKTDKNMEKVIEMLTETAEMARINTQTLTKLSSTVHDFDARLRRMEDGSDNTVAGANEEIVYTEELAQPKRQKNLDDHRTAPHKLIMLWPSLGPLFKATQDRLDDGYVMEAEDRGLPRVYGRGEGIDEDDGTRQAGTSSPAATDGSSPEASTPTPPDGQWGYGFASQQYLGQDASRSQPYPAGGLKPDGTLDLDAGTIDNLFNSYLKHMHIMHPFLDEKGTRELVRKFKARYSPGRPLIPGSQFVSGIGGNESDRPLKRQRSNGPGSMASESYPGRVVQTERSPGNAIVYLVLALGKICSHKEQLPGVVQDRVLNTNQVLAHSITGNPGFSDSSPMSVNIKPSPTSPNMTPNNLATPPANENGGRGEPRSRRSSFDTTASTSTPRNMDVIPGLAYYAKAAEILGDQADGNDLIHAQMFLLAGLYKGQLARVMESMSWITMAGRVIQILLDRYKLYNHNYWTLFGDVRKIHKSDRDKIKTNRQGRIVLAAWTCLQLESDILAELRFPSSGMQSIENLLIMPLNLRDEDDSGAYTELQENDQVVLIYYTAQMFLRKRLNQVHREMYGPECMMQTLPEVKQILVGHAEVIEEWRNKLPSPLQWQDDDPPPADILPARLRAKYWGAKYVINRVFLDYALHIMSHVREGRRVEDVAVDVHNAARDKAEVHLFKAIQSNFTEKHVWDASTECIRAAMHSTVAFDGVPDRLIVTNIHGTAHAQFGNMLVLAAAYQHPVLVQLVPEERFQQLLQRTIQFLRRLSPISPTCKHDCSILEKINRNLFPVKDEAKAVYRNEGVIDSVSASNSFTT